MEGLQGPINSFFWGEMGFPQMSFLQMLNAKHQSEEEEGEGYEAEHEDDKKQLHFQIQQLLKLQNRYNQQMNPQISFEQIGSCVTQSETKAAGDGGNVGPKEKRKRKRSRAAAPVAPAATKNPQEIETQRINHIAVERNRRKLMNSHLNALRALMPPSFVHRSDQASIISGAIDFVKELEQLLVSLQAKKRTRTNADTTTISSSVASASCTDADDEVCHIARPSEFLTSPQYVSYSKCQRGADVEATVTQGHVNLKVVGRKKQGQLVRAIAALEEIGLSVMHLSINSLDACSILYSLNLKIEEESKLRSADEIATVVHQIFRYING